MKFLWLDEVRPRPGRRVAIGTFDGVHRGHRRVIAGCDTVLTFEPHPLAVLRPDAAPPLLSPLAIKRDLLAALGVEELVVARFDQRLADTPADRFVDEVIVEQLTAEFVSVGENFRFGRGAAGDAELLARDDRFETRVVPLASAGGEPISSSRIRELVAGGEVLAAAELLGHPFLFEGEVTHGDRRGRELGFPTANIVPDPRLCLPAKGIYAALADGQPAAVSIGERPTFTSARGLLVEAYLIDFAGDLYGKRLRLAFIERLRDELRFASASELVAQMCIDVEQAREACARATAQLAELDRAVLHGS